MLNQIVFLIKKTVQNVGNIIAIDYMVVGAITLIKNTIRINLRMLEVNSSRSIFSKEIEGIYPDDVFNLQDQLSIMLIDALNLKISSLEKEKLLKDPSTNLEAYQYYNNSLSMAEDNEKN